MGGGKLVLAWPEVGNISYSSADIAQPTWSQRFSRSIEGDERSLSLAVDKNGQGIVGYLHVPYRGNGYTLSDTADIFITPVEIGSVITDVRDKTSGIKDKHLLFDAYPNPFSSTTKIRFHLTQNSMVTLKIFDIHGREVTTLINEKRSAGYYEENFNAINLSNGTYFLRLQTNIINETKKMILLK